MPTIPKRYGVISAPASGWPLSPVGTENDRMAEARDLFRASTMFIPCFEVLVSRLEIIERALLRDLLDDSQSTVDEIAALVIIEQAATDLMFALESLNGGPLYARIARHHRDFSPVEFVRSVDASGAVNVIAQSACFTTAGNVAAGIAHPGWSPIHPLTLVAQESAAERKALEPHRASEDRSPHGRLRVDPRRRLCDRACALLAHLGRKDEINSTAGGLLHQTMIRLWDRATGTKGFYAVAQHHMIPDTLSNPKTEIGRHSVASSIHGEFEADSALTFWLRTHYGTYVYLNSSSGLRHGLIAENAVRVRVLITSRQKAILYSDKNCSRPLSFPCLPDGSLAGPTIDQDGSQVTVGVTQLFDIRAEGLFGGLSYRGTYLCSEPDGRVVLNRNELGAWEQFMLIQTG